MKGINLIVECQDFDADSSGNKDAKRHYLKDYWIPAANNLKTYGQWDLLEVRDIGQMKRRMSWSVWLVTTSIATIGRID